MHDLVVAMTGASGSIYAVRLLEVLLWAGRNVHLTISPAAVQVLRQELGLELDLRQFDPELLFPTDAQLPPDSPLRVLRRPQDPDAAVEVGQPGVLTYHHYQDYSAGIASGSFLTGGMVLCPCSIGTLSSIAGGLSSNLIHRAAEVHLKERRKLVLVPRETPLSTIVLENMKRLADAGAVILPAMPAFYHQPQSMADLVDFVVARICDQLGVHQALAPRWGSGPAVS